MKKIYINARFLTQPASGVQQYAANLSLMMQELNPDIQFVTCKEVKQEALAKKLGAIPVGHLQGHTWEQFELPVWLKKNGSPLLINLCNTAPVTYKNQLNTIHDLAFEKNEPWFTTRFKYYYKWLIPKVVKNCHKLITVSQFSKKEISTCYDLNENNITVVPNSISAELENLIKMPKLPESESYFLAVGSLDPRKNLHGVIQAFLSLKLPDVKLKIAGRRNEVFRDIQGGFEPDHPQIDWIEDAETADLVHLYRNAIALLNFSFYEGFGLNNLEAMACGCPLIISDLEVFHEVCGAVALYVNPKEKNEAAGAMLTVMQDHENVQQRRIQGTERAALFSRQQAAETLKKEIIAAGY